MERFKTSPFRYIKQNLGLIVILPALCGGLWQVLELARMSFSFIRFFSVGQIIPDGLLVLLFIVSFLISSLLLIHLWRKLDDKEDNSEGPITPKKGNVLYAVLLFLMSMAFLVGIVYIDLGFIDMIGSFYTLILYSPTNIFLAAMSLACLYYSAIHCKDLKYFDEIQKAILGFKTLPFAVPALMFLSFIFQFHDAFTFPIELKNVENIVCKMEQIDEFANIELLYSNDKYVFVQCDVFTRDWKGKPRSSEIRIFQFEDLFDDTACVGSKRIRARFVKDAIWDSKQAKSLPPVPSQIHSK